MTGAPVERRLLFVHAHPDDESILTGATMAKYAAEGVGVTLVTCTRGEEGEIIPPELAHLGAGSALAAVRERELAAACAALGVPDHRFLGPYEDSGMMGTEANERPTAFWQADLEEAAGRLARVIREVRAQVVVTYDERGGYGHPDHIQAHRVTVLAVDAAGDPERYPGTGEPWRPAKLYHVSSATGTERRLAEERYDAAGRPGSFRSREPGEGSSPTPEEDITTTVDAGDFLDRKLAAIAAHRTQALVAPPFFALSNLVLHEARGEEHFVLARGQAGPRCGPRGREESLFAGLFA